MTADAFTAVKLRPAVFKFYGLVAAVGTGYGASSAPYTFCGIKLREQYGVPFEDIGGIAQGVKSGAYDVFYGTDAQLRQIVVQSGFQIVYDPVAVLHHRGGNLDRT